MPVNEHTVGFKVALLGQVFPSCFGILINLGFTGFGGAEAFAKAPIVDNQNIVAQLMKAMGMFEILSCSVSP